MFCPRCASKQTEDVKFCTVCGANLAAVRQIVDTRDAEKFMLGGTAEERKAEIERRLGLSPEVKRYNEIKTGVILSSIGLGLMIFLYVFMRGIAGNVDRDAAEIITRIWVSGLIPFFVGVAFMINGTFISKRMLEIQNRNSPPDPNQLRTEANPKALRTADTNEFIPTGFSVTESTTRHLNETRTKR